MRKLPLFPTFGNVLKKTFVELYNSMGLSVLISCTWCLGFLPILFMMYGLWGGLANAHGLQTYGERFAFLVFGSLIVVFWNGLVTGPLTTAWYSLYQARKTDYPSFKLFKQIVKKIYWRSAVIHWLFSAVALILFLNIIIALRNANLLLVVAGVLSAYILFLACLASFYFHPLIHLDNSFKKVIKKSFLLTLDNFGLSFWFSLFLGLMFLLSISLIFPLLLIYGAVAVYVTDNGFEPIYQKYDEE
jgi:Predicted integral membrane protein